MPIPQQSMPQAQAAGMDTAPVPSTIQRETDASANLCTLALLHAVTGITMSMRALVSLNPELNELGPAAKHWEMSVNTLIAHKSAAASGNDSLAQHLQIIRQFIGSAAFVPSAVPSERALGPTLDTSASTMHTLDDCTITPAPSPATATMVNLSESQQHPLLVCINPSKTTAPHNESMEEPTDQRTVGLRSADEGCSDGENTAVEGYGLAM
ncbi:hypothetical protein BKA93DRAFT_826246 [Sparassis latifolia]